MHKILSLKIALIKSLALSCLLTSFSFSLIAAPLLQRGSEQTSPSNQSNQTNTQSDVNQNAGLASYELYQQLEAMQTEVQKLHGMLEEQNYEIERLKQAEKERYADLDRRMNDIQMQTITSSNSSDTQQNLAASNSTIMDEDLKTYTSAKQKVDSKEYNAAIAEFTLYLEFFPQGKYVPQAHYWLGELYMALAIPETDNAKKHFETVVNEFPSHAKVPDCLYKIGLIQKTQNKNDAAKLTFQKLVKDFPKSASASLAKTQLETL